MFGQRGNASTVLIGAVAAASLTGVVVQQNQWQQKEPLRKAEFAQTDVNKLNSALNRYYLENRSFPTTVNALVQLGYYTGDVTSPYGTPYVINTLPSGNVEIRFATANQRDRSFALAKIRGAQDLSGTVKLEVGKPAREAVQSNLLHRIAVAGRPELNRMETDIDLDGNSINNVNVLSAETADVDTVTAGTANTTNLNVKDYIDFGAAGRLSAVGSGLSFTSNNVAYSNNVSVGNDLSVGNELSVTGLATINGNMSVTGNIGMSGGSLSGFSNIQGGSMSLTGALVSNSVSTSTLSANTVTANDFSITNRLDASTGVFGDVKTVSFDVGNLNVSGAFTFGNLTVSNTLTSSSNANLNSASINTLTASTSALGVATASSLSVVGNVTADTVTSTNWTTGTHTATNVVSKTANFDTANVVNLSGQNAFFNAVDANRVETPFLVASDAQIGALTVSGNMSVNGNIAAGSLNVSGTTTTNTLNATTGTITTLSSGNATFTTVNAQSFVGGSFSGSDFSTGTASVNSNYGLIQNYISQWNSCINADGCK